MKQHELYQLYKDKDGAYHAIIKDLRSRSGEFYKENIFLGYSKKEILTKLQNDCDCIVRKGF